MDDLQSILGIIGLLLMLLGIAGVVVWMVSTVRRDYPRLGPISFALAAVGLIIWLVGGYMGGR